MKIICKDNEGFEDIITKGKVYAPISVGSNDYKIINDKGRVSWLGTSHFGVIYNRQEE